MKKKRRAQFTLVKPVRFATEEWRKIQGFAAEVHSPPSTYVRQTALGYRLSGRINSRAVAELSRIGNNLNQLTRIANATGRIHYSQRLNEDLNQLTKTVRRLA